MAASHDPNQNYLLAALSAAEFKHLLPHLELVPMPLGKVYCESGSKLQHVYFPTTAIVSIFCDLENDAPAEIAGMGNEGMLGISLFMGGNAIPNRAFVRAAGYGYRLKARKLVEEFNCGGSMRGLLLRYTQALIVQTSQTAECNRHHSVAQRLCRWLLLTHDRVPSNGLTVTQELVAGMLGVSREAIAEAARKLQQAGLISFRRGHIAVLDRLGLEHHACECYKVVRMELDRLFGLDWDWRPMPESIKTWSRASMSICA